MPSAEHFRREHPDLPCDVARVKITPYSKKPASLRSRPLKTLADLTWVNSISADPRQCRRLRFARLCRLSPSSPAESHPPNGRPSSDLPRERKDRRTPHRLFRGTSGSGKPWRHRSPDEAGWPCSGCRFLPESMAHSWSSTLRRLFSGPYFSDSDSL